MEPTRAPSGALRAAIGAAKRPAGGLRCSFGLACRSILSSSSRRARMLRGAVIRLSEAHPEAGAWSMADTLQNHGKKDWRCEAASVNRSPRAQETWSDVGRNSDVRVAACRGQRCKPARTVGQPSAAARAIPCGPGGATPPRTDRGGARQKSFLLSVQYREPVKRHRYR